MRRAVHRRTGVDYEADALTELVNDGAQAVAAEGQWPWLERAATLTLVPGTTRYTMPADWIKTRSITVGGDEVPFVSVRDIDSDENFVGYATSGDYLTVSPAPTRPETVLMRYLASESEMSSDNEVPKLPPAFHGAIVEWACAEVRLRKGDMRASEAHRQEYAGWISRIRKGIARQTGPRRIRVRPGGGL